MVSEGSSGSNASDAKRLPVGVGILLVGIGVGGGQPKTDSHTKARSSRLSIAATSSCC